MDKKQAIELLKQALTEIPKLKAMHYGNQEFKLWCARVETIIKEGLDADDYNRLDSVQSKYFPDELAIDHLSLEEDYLPKLNDYKIVLKSIIQKYEILGIAGEGDKGGEVEKMDEDSKQGIIDELESFHTELKSYKRLLDKEKQLSENQNRYKESLRGKLERKSGALKRIIIEITKKQYYGSGLTGTYDIWVEAFNTIAMSSDRTAITLCISALNEAIGKLEDDIKNDIRDKKTGLLVTPQTKITTEAPKAFIAHEGETKALGKLKTFLDALGVKCLIAEIEPSNGRLVEPQVTRTYGDADFAIILATKGKVIDKQKKNVHYMGMNVADELGRAREIFKNRIILLLETGVQPHTNISGIVHERFTPQSMDKAFTKIVKELKNWGFIRAGKVEE